MMHIVTDLNTRAPTQDVLFVLDRVRVHRHAAAGLHDEATHGEVGSLLGSDEHLAASFPVPALTSSAGKGIDVLYGHGNGPLPYRRFLAVET